MPIKLIKTWQDFTEEMKRRFMSKKNMGFSGWENKGYFDSMLLRMQNKANKISHHGSEEDLKNLVDIANFAMFLHYQLTRK